MRTDPDTTFHPDADTDPNPNPSFQVKAQTLEKVPEKQAHIPYILACHLQIDVDLGPVPDTGYHFDADPNALKVPFVHTMFQYLKR